MSTDVDFSTIMDWHYWLSGNFKIIMLLCKTLQILFNAYLCYVNLCEHM